MKFIVNRKVQPDGPKYKLPLHHYKADDYDGTSVWVDKGTDLNNMTKREGLITKYTPFTGAEF
jgi:hypothetical protein